MVRKAAQSTPNELLRRTRLERGWTQKDIADRIGSPLNVNVNRWERGTAFPSAYYVQRLCEVFGKSASELGLLPPAQVSQVADNQPAFASVSPPSESPGLWNIPFGRNLFFTGRAQIFSLLHERFNQDGGIPCVQSLALSGLGGIGKTQAAIEYAYRYRDEYRAVFWVRAASQETLVTDLVALARLLELSERDTQDQEKVIASVANWLAVSHGWLLILDNADDLSFIPHFLPTRGQGHVLLTTRAQATGKIAQSLSVEKLETDEAALLLARRAKLLAPDAPLDQLAPELCVQARTIVREVDGLPLALEQAGAYIEETDCSFSEYLVLYRRSRQSLLNWASALAPEYPYTVASTWLLSFQQVEQECPEAAELLRFCAFLDPDAIPEEMLTAGVTKIGPVAADPFVLNESIQALRRYSLVKRNPETKLLTIHRLVQAVLRDSMEKQEARQWAERVIRAVNAVFPAGGFAAWSRCERYLSQALTCATLTEQLGFTFPEAAHVLDRAGYYMGSRGLYGPGEALLRRALAIYKQTSGPAHPDVARLLNELAMLCNTQGKVSQVEALLQQALAIREQALGAEHPETASTLNELAVLYTNQGKYAQAEHVLQRALSIREHLPEIEHADLAESLNDLGLLLVYQGKYAEAEPLYLRALAIREQLLEPGHPDLAATLNNLAWLSNNQSKYEQAQHLYLRALAILEQTLEPTHPHRAALLNNLADVYLNQGKYAEAEPLCQRALAIREQVMEPDNPYIAVNLNTLGELYRHQGKYEQAEPLYQRALAIREQAFGPTHTRVAQSLANLARLRFEQGQDEQAEPLYQRALALYEQVLDADHPDIARLRTDYAKFLQKRRETEDVTQQWPLT